MRLFLFTSQCVLLGRFLGQCAVAMIRAFSRSRYPDQGIRDQGIRTRASSTRASGTKVQACRNHRPRSCRFPQGLRSGKLPVRFQGFYISRTS